MILPYDTDFGPPRMGACKMEIKSPSEVNWKPWLPWEPALSPVVVARCVVQDAMRKYHRPIPSEWADELVRRADVHLHQTPSFRKKMRRGGEHARDWLWAFMEHWLAVKVRGESIGRVATPY